MNKLAIVILNWNGMDMLPTCLDSLASQSYKNFQIIVIDNKSQDNSRDILNKYQMILGEKIHIIYNKKNSGFAGGVNIGIRYALRHNFDGIALFNNDAVADKDWLLHLESILSVHNDVGIVTGLLLHRDGKTIDSTGDWYTSWGLPTPLYRDRKSEDAPNSSLVFGASGGASLYRSSLLRETGLFDENFFAYYEDVDMSFRAQLSGYKVYYEKKAIAYHEQGGTSKKIPGFTIYQTFKNLPLLFIKNVPIGLIPSVGSRFILAYWLMFFGTLRHGTLLFALKGLVSSVYYSPQALYKRFGIQKNKKVSNVYIQSIIYPDIPPLQTGLIRFRDTVKRFGK